MQIAIASGKGGTGKTTVAVSLALYWSRQMPVTLLDCDVEEPNVALFLPLNELAESPVTVPVPQINHAACVGCGACARACRFNALAKAGEKILFFPELCHNCGACSRVCGSGAITEIERRVGTLVCGSLESLTLIQGQTEIGEHSTTAVIRAVKQAARAGLTIRDCPPGTACPMVESVKDADFVILVTEPTPFGLHDLRQAVATARALQRPCGVILNRADEEDDSVREYCEDSGIPLLAEIPNQRAVAEAYAVGTPLLQAAPELAPVFDQTIAAVQAVAAV